MTLENIIRHISESASDAWGMESSFWRLNDTIGVKSFQSEKTRDRCYDLQRTFAKHGLAPKVYSKFEHDDYYYYITECIEETMRQRLYREHGTDKVDDGLYSATVNHKIPEVAELCTNIRKLGFILWDNHPGNYGFLRGKPVWIDFDQFDD